VNMIMGLWEGIKATWEKLVGGVKGLVSGFTSLFTGKKDEPAKAAAPPPKPEEKAAAPKPPTPAPPPIVAPPKIKAPVLKSDARGEALVTGRPIVNAPDKAAIPSRPAAAAPVAASEKVMTSGSSFDVMRMFGPSKAPEMAAEILKKTQYSLGRGKIAEADDSVKITETSSADDLIRYLGTKRANAMSKKLLENKAFISNEDTKKLAGQALSDGDAAKAKGGAEKQAEKAAAKAAKQSAKEEEKAAKVANKKSNEEPPLTPSTPKGLSLPNLASVFSLPQTLGIGEGLGGVLREVIPPLTKTSASSIELPTPLLSQPQGASAKDVVVNFTVNLNITPSQNSSQSEAQAIADEVQKALASMKQDLAKAVSEALERDRRLQFSSF